MRWFVRCGYDGTEFHGWQIQPNAISVQETLEIALEKLLNMKTPVVGCGRTDTGVHALSYFFHFDTENKHSIVDQLKYKLNEVLPAGIGIYDILPVKDDAHARFDADKRAYIYDISFENNPFHKKYQYYWKYKQKPATTKLNEVAELILKYNEFKPFCKSNSGLDHYRCTLFQAYWEETSNGLQFYIQANRFLRGMVRLIVGTSIYYATGKISLEEIKTALDTQTELGKSYSAPAEGLALYEIEYPSSIFL